ncbi:hypothetical protein NP493_73g02012 [Ridgeia piscesae]|uniref:Anti-proliferative protein domain-containing protein n=1 Tax=Ridgeia piscesae TaxID=27915 RepID=A0AAD9PA19_RIDPI|nr:hypothetical protein NP493_73g02012 [Ridgeia piscesae]
MREEIAAAVVFLTRLIMKNEKLSREQVAEFSANLSAILGERFKNHWYLEDPTKGQAYRCIRINEAEPVDPVLVQAALNSGLTYKDLRLPTELTLWVDPADVCCRFGENKGSYCTLASFKDGSSDSSQGVLNIDEALQLEQQHKLSESLRLQPLLSAGTARRSSLRCKPVHCSVTTRGIKTGGSVLGSQTRAYHAKRWLHAAAPSGTSFIKYQYSTSTPHNPVDRLHWVRGVDLVKA